MAEFAMIYLIQLPSQSCGRGEVRAVGKTGPLGQLTIVAEKIAGFPLPELVAVDAIVCKQGRIIMLVEKITGIIDLVNRAQR